MTKNQKAFLDLIAWSEGTTRVQGSDDGYNVLVGGKLFEGYTDHPRIKVDLPKLHIYSTAAGRYQILRNIFDAYKKQLGLPDFGHDSQDRIALQLIEECKALDDIDQGNIARAISKCASRWASFPGNNYGQYIHKIGVLLAKYKEFVSSELKITGK